jgi:RNA 2',3'-cyclic 3'-phosphodiesterase
MRLFVALEIPATVRDEFARLSARLAPLAPHVRWTALDNTHLTLKFIGEVEASRETEIKAALSPIRRPQPIRVVFRGLGFFMTRHHIVLFGNVEESASLTALAGEVGTALHPRGVPSEHREYRPHVTLARIQNDASVKGLMTEVRKLGGLELGVAEFHEFFLIQSTLRPQGAEHTRLARFAFAPPGTSGAAA